MPGLAGRGTFYCVAGVVLLSGLLWAPAATASATQALSFTVNTTVDAPDAHPGSGVCADSAGQCSLRAAIEESDAQPAGTVTDVTVPSGVYALSLGTLSVTANTINVTGAGQSATVIENAKKVKGQLVDVVSKSTATFAALELTGGKVANKVGGALMNSGTTTLKDVLVTANASTSGGGITNTSGAHLTLLKSTVSNNITAQGNNNSSQGGSGAGILNAGTLHVTGSTVSGNRAGRGGFGSTNPAGSGGDGGGIANTGTVTVTSSTITGNSAGSGGIGLAGNEPSGPGGNGGGIYSSGGSVTLTNSVVSGNTAGPAGPLGEGVPPHGGSGGGIWSSATLQVTNSSFSTNAGGSQGKTGGGGGAIFTSGNAVITSSAFTTNIGGLGGGAGGNGGAIDNSGSLALSQSTVSGNTAGQGGESGNGGNGGGLYTSSGSASLTGDTFDSNAGGNGGASIPIDPGCTAPGFGGDGGAVYSSATITVVDTTISGNSVGQGGNHVPPCAGQAPNGVGAGMAVNGKRAAVSYSTIADNSDGIDNLSGSVFVNGTIVADSTGPNCTGLISEGFGYNLDSGTTCGFKASSDITGTEPALGALANNGGPTETQALQSGSPAIDHGGSSADGCPATDQRGLPRPDESADNGACDMGAYESQGLG